MLRTEWDKSWIELFGVLWNGIVGSVVIVWFLFQVGESSMGAYTYALEWAEERRRKRAEYLKEIKEEGRREERERQSRFEQELRNQGIPEDKIRNAGNLSDSSSK